MFPKDQLYNDLLAQPTHCKTQYGPVGYLCHSAAYSRHKSDLCPETLHNLRSACWLPWANDTVCASGNKQLDPWCSMQIYHRPNQPHYYWPITKDCFVWPSIVIRQSSNK